MVAQVIAKVITVVNIIQTAIIITGFKGKRECLLPFSFHVP